MFERRIVWTVGQNDQYYRFKVMKRIGKYPVKGASGHTNAVVRNGQRFQILINMLRAQLIHLITSLLMKMAFRRKHRNGPKETVQ